MELPQSFGLDRKTLLINLIIPGVLGAMLVYMTFRSPVFLIFAPFTILFVMLAVGIMRKLGDQSAQLLVSSEGFTCKQFPFGHLPWNDIQSIDVVKFQRQSYLCFHLVDPLKYRHHYGSFTKAAAKFSRLLGVPETSIAIGFLTLEWSHIRAMQQHLAKMQRKSAA